MARSKNINRPITVDEIKPGDKIRVTAEHEVRDSRVGESTRLGRIGIVTVPDPKDPTQSTQWAVLESDHITLLERDVSIEIPEDALMVFWQDVDGYDYYARKLEGGTWKDSDEDTYDTVEELIEAITGEKSYSSGDKLREGSFRVVESEPQEGVKEAEEPKFTTGGYVNPNPLSFDFAKLYNQRIVNPMSQPRDPIIRAV